MISRRALLAAAVVGLVPVATGARADPGPGERGPVQQPRPPAPASIASEVLLLHATNDNTGIDPRIGRIPALGKPPFTAYNSYRLVARTPVPLARGRAENFRLPNGNELRLVYRDAMMPDRPGQLVRYLVAVSIHKPDGSAVLPLVEYNAEPGDWFWVRSQAYQGGRLFIGIRLG